MCDKAPVLWCVIIVFSAYFDKSQFAKRLDHVQFTFLINLI